MRVGRLRRCGAAIYLVALLATLCCGHNGSEPVVADGCVSKFCVTKCCPYGESLAADKTCKPSPRTFFPCFSVFEWDENDLDGESYNKDDVVYCNGTNGNGTSTNNTQMDDFNLMISNNCNDNRFRLEPYKEETDEFYLLANGTLYVPFMYQQALNYNEYCMETFLVDNEEMILPLICFPPKSNITEAGESFHFILYPIGLLISVPFLLVTFLVYTLIPELRDLHGKSLCSYVLCLTVAYVCLATVQLGGQAFAQEFCVGVALAIQFSFIACFCWLNVLSFDTWRNVTFHGNRYYSMSKKRERKYFLGYSIYAWGMTTVFVLVTVVLNFTPTIPAAFLKPSIGESSCWFDSDTSGLPYFYGPVSVLIFINVVLFISTSLKLVHEHHQRGLTVQRTPKQTFRLCVTLFFLMGISWVMELISWAAGGPSTYWFVTDVLNTLQGIFVFVIFVMERRVKHLVRTVLIPRVASWCPACCCWMYAAAVERNHVEIIDPSRNTRDNTVNTFMFPIREDDELQKF